MIIINLFYVFKVFFFIVWDSSVILMCDQHYADFVKWFITVKSNCCQFGVIKPRERIILRNKYWSILTVYLPTARKETGTVSPVVSRPATPDTCEYESWDVLYLFSTSISIVSRRGRGVWRYNSYNYNCCHYDFSTLCFWVMLILNPVKWRQGNPY